MARKETLEIKKAVSEATVGETKRCLAVLNRVRDSIRKLNEDINIDTCFNEATKEIIEGCPFLEFYSDLRKKLPR